MFLTPKQIAKIRAKEAATPDALKRNPLNDYTEGGGHVTLNTRGEAPVLGYITGNAEAADGSHDAPRCVLTELGRKVEESWKAVPSFYPEVEIEEFKAMPDHVHGLLHLKPTNRVHLGQIIRGFMIGCTHGYWDTLGIAWGGNLQKGGGAESRKGTRRRDRYCVRESEGARHREAFTARVSARHRDYGQWFQRKIQAYGQKLLCRGRSTPPGSLSLGVRIPPPRDAPRKGCTRLSRPRCHPCDVRALTLERYNSCRRRRIVPLIVLSTLHLRGG